MAIALVLSGLVHGLVMFGNFNTEILAQSPGPQVNFLYLEIAAQEAEINSKQKDKSTHEVDKKTIVSQQNVLDEESLNRVEKQLVSDDREVADQLHNSIDDYQQIRRLSKPVDNHDVLIQLVYQAINQKKRYPYMARRMGQQGKVTLSFVMHPDGQVTDIVLLESSQYSSLDRAAEESIAAIAPFVQAADYLAYKKIFDIAVEFRLN